MFNIPLGFHAADLRSFFSAFLSRRRFARFHYRHRRAADGGKTCECWVRLRSRADAAAFVAEYKGKPWTNRRGDFCDLTMNCGVRRAGGRVPAANLPELSVPDGMPNGEPCLCLA